VSLSASLVCVASFGKGTTIDGALRLAAKRHESVESINLIRTEHQFDMAHFLYSQKQEVAVPTSLTLAPESAAAAASFRT